MLNYRGSFFLEDVDIDNGANDLIFLHITRKRQSKRYNFQYKYGHYIKCTMMAMVLHLKCDMLRLMHGRHASI